MHRFILTFFLLGFSFGIGPCLASCGPLLVSYVAGTQKNTPKAVFSYILFSFSRILAYLFLSFFIFFSRYISLYISIFGGLFMMLIGFFMLLGKNLEHKVCRRIQLFLLEKDKKTILLFGLIIGLLPCAPLISALTYIGLVSKSWLTNLFYSISFGLGTLFSPLLAIVALTGLIPGWAKCGNSFYRIFNWLCGLIIIFLGLQLTRRAF